MKVSPISQLFGWSRIQESNRLEIVHLKAWVPPHCEDQAVAATADNAQLATSDCFFGSQPLRSPHLILDLEKNLNPKNEHVCTLSGLNVTTNSDLCALLQNIAKRKGVPLYRIKIGIVGIWTESLIQFLSYELRTRLGVRHIAMCSALTASRSRLQHFNALDLLQKLFRVDVMDSIVAFTDWLVQEGDGALALMPVDAPPLNNLPRLEFEPNGSIEQLSTIDKQIIGFLYSDYRSLVLSKLTQGFSGALVFLVTATDLFGHEQPSTVLKLASAKKTAREKNNFEKIEEVLGYHAPSIRGYMELRDRAGVKYSYTSMTDGEAHSLKELYEDYNGVPQSKIAHILRRTFDEILERLYAAATYEQIDLFAAYEFDGTGWNYASGGSDVPDRLKERIKDLLQLKDLSSASQDYIEIAGEVLPNVALFMQHELPQIKKSYMAHSFHFVSFVHGDLNLKNCLIDPAENVFLIDFEYTSRTHILKDVLKVENDIMYESTVLESEAELRQAMRITLFLARVQDLGEPLTSVGRLEEEAPEIIRVPKFKRLWDTLILLRETVRRIVRQDRNPVQVYIVLLRYALHICSMDHIPRLNRIWSLAAACIWSTMIDKSRLRHQDIFVDFIPRQAFCRSAVGEAGFGVEVAQSVGRLGITILPGRIDRGANVKNDLRLLREKYGVTKMVCLVTESELETMADRRVCARAVDQYEMEVVFAPIAGLGAPTLHKAKALATWIAQQVIRGECVVLFSMAGLGRSCLMAAVSLLELSAYYGGGYEHALAADDAIQIIRQTRSTRALNVQAQVDFIFRYHAYMSNQDAQSYNVLSISSRDCRCQQHFDAHNIESGECKCIEPSSDKNCDVDSDGESAKALQARTVSSLLCQR